MEIRFELWQARNDEDFLSRSVNCAMKPVYSGMIEFNADPDGKLPVYQTLDKLFEMFNINHPHDFTGHSMSVHDIVCLGETSYQCMPIGWEVCPAPSNFGPHDVVELPFMDPNATVCGYCRRGWDDTISTSLTPVPSGRCPFEYDHEEQE